MAGPLASGRASPHEEMALDVQIGECTGDVQPVGILGDAAIAHANKTKDAFDDQEWMFALGPHL